MNVSITLVQCLPWSQKAWTVKHFVLLEKQIEYCLEMQSIYVSSFFAWTVSMAL